MENSTPTHENWLDRSLSSILPRWNVRTLIILVILVLAVISRFAMLGARTMSHDEVNHVVPSYDLFQGKGYRHDPITHGPFQFHIIALTYFLFGDSDFTSRVPAAIFSVAAIAFVMIGFRKYLGNTGSLVGGLLFLISPYMLFYGRYTRNEAFIELFGVVLLYGILRYLDKGDRLSLFLVTGATVMHFAVKETAYIYTAQALLFIGLLFLEDITRLRWNSSKKKNLFITLMLAALICLIAALGFAVANAGTSEKTTAVVETTAPAFNLIASGEIIALALVAILGVFALVILVRSLGWKSIRSMRSFDLLILLGTLVLPLLSAFPIKIMGFDPLDYQSQGLIRSGIVIAIFFAIAIAIGLWWNRNLWIANAVLFYGVFTILYTTLFTNGVGFFTGLIGSLGYWLEQQGVNRGSQPWYYYTFVQLPIYEFLAVSGTVLAVYFGIRHKKFTQLPDLQPAEAEPEKSIILEVQPEDQVTSTEEITEEVSQPEEPRRIPVLYLLVFWSISSLAAFTLAGEKMPWLTVHIALPMLLAAGWGLGYLIDSTPWKDLKRNRAILSVLIAVLFIISLSGTLGSLLGDQPPFAGQSLTQLEATANFLLSLLGLAGSAAGLVYLLRNWHWNNLFRLVVLVFFAFLAVLTSRAAYQASYINYEYATEYLVYAHAGTGPKQILAQVEEISQRLTGGLDLKVAYDNESLYPYWWYLRRYPNIQYFGETPTRDLKEAPIILVGSANYSKLDSIVRDQYVYYDYTRLWWPMEDYSSLSIKKVWEDLKNPAMRAAIFQIWLNRDYEPYAKLEGRNNLTLSTWQPSNHIRMYIRKDIIAQIWDYGAAPVTYTEVETDPYVNGIMQLQPDFILDGAVTDAGPFNEPHGIAFAEDGTLYLADTKNHRILHFDAEGNLLQKWGTLSGTDAAPGTFNEPWGIAVAPDGSVLVADTWNHRIQRFTAEGKYLNSWGYFGQEDNPDAFWGPRDVAVDEDGRVYVSDTGNKRIVVFNLDGNYITKFGTAGMETGMLDEPVGIAVDKNGNVYVADTWNQRIQEFSPDATRTTYVSTREWEIAGWYGESTENKPYISVDQDGNLYVADPEGYRVLVFTGEGVFKYGWGEYSIGMDGFALVGGIEVAPDGKIWVVDSGNNRILRFAPPVAAK
jgi:predicted membrane-bound mannosyltransferase/DNA-binding beta-propeller fold protein YncE